MAGKTYVVTGAYVTMQADTPEGPKVVGRYEGAPVPEGVPARVIEHLLGRGLITEQRSASPPPSAPGDPEGEKDASGAPDTTGEDQDPAEPPPPGNPPPPTGEDPPKYQTGGAHHPPGPGETASQPGETRPGGRRRTGKP